MESKLDDIREVVKYFLPEMIALQKELTAIPALGPENQGEGEAAKAEFLSSYLAELKIGTLRNFNAPDPRVPSGIRPNILLSVPGIMSHRSLFIISHMDVVPPGDIDAWQHNPFEAVVKYDRIIGRGVEDNQQGIVTSIFALKTIKKLGLQPVTAVNLLFVADEETGSKKGLQYLVKTHRDLFQQKDLFLVPDYGDEKGSSIEIAEKSVLWLKVHIKGKQCHASAPHKGINTLRATAYFISASEGLADIFPASDPLFRPQQSTFEPTKKEPNVPNINTIPGDDVLYFDCRILPQYQIENVLEAFSDIAKQTEKKMGVQIDMEPVMADQAAPQTSPDAPVVKNLMRGIKELRNLQPRVFGIGGATVAAPLRKLGCNVAVWQTITRSAHQPNEYCLFENMLQDTEVMAYLMLCPEDIS